MREDAGRPPLRVNTGYAVIRTDGVFASHRSYILMRKAVACELGGSVVEVDCAVDLNRALRMVWGSTSGVGWEEARWPAGRDKDGGRPSFFALPPPPGVSLSLLWESRGKTVMNRNHNRMKIKPTAEVVTEPMSARLGLVARKSNTIMAAFSRSLLSCIRKPLLYASRDAPKWTFLAETLKNNLLCQLSVPLHLWLWLRTNLTKIKA